MRTLNFLSRAVLIGALAAGSVHAAEVGYDITTCSQGTVTTVFKSKELTVFSIESFGIARSNDGNKTFDGSTAHCIGTGKVTPTGSVRQGYCKYIRPNGDELVGEWRRVNKEDGTWKYLHGTGTLAGIQGGGTNGSVVRGKPLKPGTYSSCVWAKGTYTLP